MELIKTKVLSWQQKEEVLQLWNAEYPAQLAFLSVRELEHYLFPLAQPMHYIMTDTSGRCGAWAFAFDRDNERWFAVIVGNVVQKTGLGSKLLQALKEDNQALSGWVTDHDRYTKRNGETYCSPEYFYLKNGFSLCAAQRLETENLSAAKITWSRS